MSNEEKKYELRAINSSDLFIMIRIIGKIGVKNFQRCFNSESVRNAIANNGNQDDDNLGAVGMIVMIEVADILVENLPKCENEIYQFLSTLSAQGIDDIKQLPPADFLEMIIEVIQKPEFADFFKVALRLFNKKQAN